MKPTKKTLTDVFDLLTESYPGKFVATETTEQIWSHMLSDIDADNLLAAVYHLCATRPDWPPDIATIRATAAGLAHGQLAAPTGSDSWERIRQKISGAELELEPLEKKALAQTSSIFDLRRSTSPAADRARYVDAYQRLLERQQLERMTMPKIKELMAKKTEKLEGKPESLAKILQGVRQDD